MVLGEIKGFIEADSVVNVLDSDSNSIVLSHRCNDSLRIGTICDDMRTSNKLPALIPAPF